MSEVKEYPQLSARELYRINWFLGSLLALVSLWTAAYLEFAIHGHLAVTAFLIAVVSLRPQAISWIPKLFWSGLPLLLVAVFAIDIYVNATPMPALIRLNILLILYRALTYRTRREDLQLIVLGLFLIVISGVKIHSISFFAQILIFAGLSMALLFTLTLLGHARDSTDPREAWRGFSWIAFANMLWSKLRARTALTGVLVFGSVIGCAALFFVLIPRVDLNHRLALMGVGGGTQTGFSETIRFNDITNIRNDNSIALRVEVGSRDTIPPDPYWRMLVLDDYNNGTFQVSRPVIHHARPLTKVREWSPNILLVAEGEDGEGDEAAGRLPENRWTFYLEGGAGRYLPLTGYFERVRFQSDATFNFLEVFHAIGMNRGSRSMTVYQVDNMEVTTEFRDPDFEENVLDFPFFPEVDLYMDVEYYNYPDTTLLVPARPEDLETLEDLVRIIDGGENLDARDFAARATAYLQANHTYSMTYTLDHERGDHVVRWLRSGSPGHCEAFAGALILLCRTAGFPARAVVGFRGGTWNTFENYFMVRNSDAHAWVEVFDGIDSWFRMDPTPGGGGFDGDVDELFAGFGEDSSLGAYLDSLRMLWYRRVVSFDQQSQFMAISWFRQQWAGLQLREHWQTAREGLRHWLTGPRSVRWALEGLGMLTVVGLTAFLFTFIFGSDFRRRFISWASRDQDPVRMRASQYLERLRALRDRAVRADEARFQMLMAGLQRVRFGPDRYRPESGGLFRQTRRFLRALPR